MGCLSQHWHCFAYTYFLLRLLCLASLLFSFLRNIFSRMVVALFFIFSYLWIWWHCSAIASDRLHETICPPFFSCHYFLVGMTWHICVVSIVRFFFKGKFVYPRRKSSPCKLSIINSKMSCQNRLHARIRFRTCLYWRQNKPCQNSTTDQWMKMILLCPFHTHVFFKNML